MEQNNNKVVNILSLVGVVAFFAVLIAITVFSFKNKEKPEEEYYAPIATESTPTPEPTAPATNDNPTTTIDDLLYSLASDIESLLRCNDVNYLTVYTPGITVDTISGIRSAYGKSTVDYYELYKADGTKSTTPNRGEYLIKMNVRTDKVANILYVFVWTDYQNGSYLISGINYEIGDF